MLLQILHQDQGATEVHRETLRYIKVKNITETFTKTKLFLINQILTFGSKAFFENDPFKQNTTAGRAHCRNDLRVGRLTKKLLKWKFKCLALLLLALS